MRRSGTLLAALLPTLLIAGCQSARLSGPEFVARPREVQEEESRLRHRARDLIQALRAPHGRDAAVEELLTLPQRQSILVPLMLEALNESMMVPIDIQGSVGRQGRQACYENEACRWRMNLLRVISGLRAEGAPFVPLLVELARRQHDRAQRDAGVRMNYEQALGSLGRIAWQAVEELLQRDDDVSIHIGLHAMPYLAEALKGDEVLALRAIKLVVRHLPSDDGRGVRALDAKSCEIVRAAVALGVADADSYQRLVNACRSELSGPPHSCRPCRSLERDVRVVSEH